MSRSLSAAFAACVLLSGCRVSVPPGAYRVTVKSPDPRSHDYVILSKTPPREEGGELVWTDLSGKEERSKTFKILKTEPIVGVWSISHDGVMVFLSSTEPRMEGSHVIFTDALTGESRSHSLPLGVSWKEIK